MGHRTAIKIGRLFNKIDFRPLELTYFASENDQNCLKNSMVGIEKLMNKSPLHFKHFVLADDDTDDADLFAEALAEVAPAIRFNQAANGKILLNKIDSGEFELPDVIFLDINMPEMNGWACLTELKKRPQLKNIPVIMYSTSSHVQDKKAAERLGANFFYTKPDSFKQLKAFLSGLINDPKSFHIEN